MPLQEDYQVALDAFCGPLDLLLYLIRRAEVDVNDIQIARVTEQYLEFISQLEVIDIDLAGEFLVMASTLMEIKARSLAPAETEGQEPAAEGGLGGTGGETVDPRYELVQQLLAYQRYRVASEELESRRVAFARRAVRRPARAAATEGEVEPEEIELELEDVHILDLADAYERIIASIDFTRLGDHRVELDETPLALHQEDLLDRLARSELHRLSLQDVFVGHNRGQRVGLFLATLELVRRRRVTVRQDIIDSPVEIVLNVDSGLNDEAGVVERPSDQASGATEGAAAPRDQRSERT